MLIGDTITFKGRRHRVVGFTPVSVLPFQVQLLDPVTNQTEWVEWPLADDDVERAALRVVPKEDATRSQDGRD
jgi:hypothetical protein